MRTIKHFPIDFIHTAAIHARIPFSARDLNGTPCLPEKLYTFANTLAVESYPTAKLGLGKVTLFLSKYPSKPALYVSQRSTGEPLGTLVPSGTWYPDDKLPVKDTLLCLEFANTEGIDNLIEELQKLKHQMLNGEFNTPIRNSTTTG